MQSWASKLARGSAGPVSKLWFEWEAEKQTEGHGWGSPSGFDRNKAEILSPKCQQEPLHHPFSVLDIFEIRSWELFVQD
jgi:hypothetical protein